MTEMVVDNTPPIIAYPTLDFPNLFIFLIYLDDLKSSFVAIAMSASCRGSAPGIVQD